MSKCVIQTVNNSSAEERKTTTYSIFDQSQLKLCVIQGVKMVFSEGPVISLFPCALSATENKLLFNNQI